MTVTSRLARLVLRPPTVPIVIAIVTAAVFVPALNNGFVWDDRPNFVSNPAFRGLGWTHLRWMVSTTLLGQWIPLTWLTLGIDYVVWGMNPKGYHLTNITIHVAAVLAFYFVARKLLRAATTGWAESTLTLGAAATALFFGIHPLRAESVAWVTERRDVLSGLWFLLSVLTYLKSRAPEARGRAWLAISVVCYALAVLSKSIVVTLPAVLLLLDLYPLRRIPWAPSKWLRGGVPHTVWPEKIPYAVLSGVGIAMAFYAQQSNEYLTTLQKLSIFDRVVLVFHSLWFYVSTTAIPLRLMVLYELPARIDPLETKFFASMVGTSALAGALVLLRRRWVAGLVLGAAYVIMISPVSGVFHNGHQTVADRYSYLSCLGWALLYGAGVGAAVQARMTGRLKPSLTGAAVGAAFLVLLGNGTLTMNQVGVWRDTDTLWRFALDYDPTCAICHNNLGDDLIRRGMPQEAAVEIQAALRLRPDLVRMRKNLGLALLNSGRLEEAAEEFNKVLSVEPTDGDAWTNLGVVLMHQGKLDDAVQTLEKGLRQAPQAASLYANLGAALLESGRASDAVQPLVRALKLNPESSYGRANLIRAYMALGQPDLAAPHHEVLRRLDPQLASRVSTSVATP